MFPVLTLLCVHAGHANKWIRKTTLKKKPADESVLNNMLQMGYTLFDYDLEPKLRFETKILKFQIPFFFIAR